MLRFKLLPLLIFVLAGLFCFKGPAHAASITSIATGNWSGAATSAWPITTRTGTITTLTTSPNVTGVGTAFTTELTVGNVISTGTTVIGTITTITDDTHLVLVANAAKAVTGLTYASNGVGPVDSVTVASGHNITMDVAFATVTAITINNAGAATGISISGSNKLTTLGATTCSAVSAGVAGSTIAVNGGTFVSVGTLTLNGSVTANRTCAVTLGAGTLTLGNGLTFGGASATQTKLVNNAAGTINLVGTISGAAGTFSINSGTTLVSTATATIGGAYTLGIVSVPNGTLTMGAFAVTIASNTNISGGSLKVSSATGTKTFAGFVNVTSGNFDLSGFATITSFGGGINMDGGGTFNSGTGNAGFSASQNLSGATSMIFGGSVTPAATMAITNNNSGTVTLNGTLILTGNWTQGANSTLVLANATATSGTGILTATANPNTVTYTGNGATAVKATSYYNLNWKPSGATVQVLGAGAFTVNGTLTIGDGTNTGATAATNNPAINLLGDLTIAANAVYTKGTSSTTFQSNGTQTWTDNTAGQDLGMVYINGANATVNLGSSVKATALTINANQTLSLNGSNTLTLSSATNSGNLTGSSGIIVLTFAGVAFTNTGTFTYNTSTVRFTGTGATIAALSGTGGTNGYYNLELKSSNAAQVLAAGTFAVNNNLTVGNGTNLGATAATNNSTMSVTGTMTVAAGATYTLGTAPLSVTSTTLITGTISVPAGAGAVTFGDDLTVNGTLSGATTNPITANGDVIGSGTINLTGAGQNFEQRVGANQNFFTTSGANSWTFKNLIFSNNGAAPETITTETGGTGGVTISGTLTLGKGGDTAGATTTFDPGDSTFTLSGVGTVFTQTAGLGYLCPNSLCSTNLSVFKYTGTTATTLGATTGYYDLQVVPQALGAAVAYTGGGAITVADNLTLNPQAASGGNRLLTLTLGGDLAVGNLLTLQGTTGACSAINTSSTFQITASTLAIQSGVAAGCIDNLIVNGSTITLTGTPSPLIVGASNATFTRGTGTTVYTGNGAAIKMFAGGTAATNDYYSLSLQPNGSSQQIIGAGTLDVNGNLTIGDGTNTGATASGNPTINLYGNLLINANAVYTKGTGTTTFKHGAVQTWTDNTTGQQDLGTVAVTVNTTNTTVNLGSSVEATDLAINPSQALSLNGSNTLFLSTLSSSGTLTGSSGIIQLSGTAGTPFFNSGTYNYNTSTMRFIGSGARVTALAGAAGTNGYYNLQLEPNGASAQVISTSSLVTVQVNNDLTVGDGTNAGATSVANNPTVNVLGNVIIASNANLASGTGNINVGKSWTNSGSFTANTSTVSFTGNTAGQTITSNGSSFNNLWLNGGSSGVWALQDPLTVTSTMTLTAGTLDASTNCGGVGCAISVNGSWTNPVGAGGVYIARSSTVTFATPAAGSQTVTTDGSPFYNVQFNGTGGYWTLQSSMTVLSTMTLTKGVLDTKSGSSFPILVGGDWLLSNGTTFIVNLSTVIFTGTGAQRIANVGQAFWVLIDSNTSSGGVTFASSFTATSLTIDANGLGGNTTAYFNAGSTFTVTTLKLLGTNTNHISLRPTPSNQIWLLKNVSTNTVSYVDVSYSSASAGVIITAGPNSTDLGNNTNWTFKIISVTLSPTTYDFTSVNLNATTQSVSAIGVTNSGNVTETYSLSVATTGATVWGVAIATPTSLNTFVLEGQFNTTQPAKSSFFNVDVITSTPTVSTTGIYSGNQDGVSAAVGAVKNLWMYLFMPSSTTVTSQQQMTLTVSASSP